MYKIQLIDIIQHKIGISAVARRVRRVSVPSPPLLLEVGLTLQLGGLGST